MAAGLIIAAPRSGAGKTTVTVAILAALRRRGIGVRGAKSGPDFIDPGFHAAATGLASPNLDSWAMDPSQLDAVAASLAQGADLVVIEAAMGLFDGVTAPSGRSGAAADLAARFGLPVLLVLDVSGQGQSAGAVARGFMQYEPAVRIAGVVLNKIASERHLESVRQGFAQLDLPVLGCLPRQAAIAIPERHLGLVQATEQEGLREVLQSLADLAERHFELDAILVVAAPLRPRPAAGPALSPPGQRIAVAQDAAFSFIYPHMLAGWRAAGAEIILFSPLADEAPPGECDACWLPGGYPELHAAALANMERFHTGMHRFAALGKTVHGECGGYMVLGRLLEDAIGMSYPMLGLLDHTTSFARRRLHLGYREALLLVDAAIGRAGSVLRGHEFHYATLSEPGGDSKLAQLSDARGRELGAAGGRRGHVSGSFFHVIAPVPDRRNTECAGP
jgi:cobyrinic acid a,c-diamide synthase